LAPSGIAQDKEDLERYNNDWLGKYRGQSKLVLKPNSTEQVSKILKYCNDNKYVLIDNVLMDQVQGCDPGLTHFSLPWL
jgi:FAD/FMN-containing dehydrogenase